MKLVLVLIVVQQAKFRCVYFCYALIDDYHIEHNSQNSWFEWNTIQWRQKQQWQRPNTRIQEKRTRYGWDRQKNKNEWRNSRKHGVNEKKGIRLPQGKCVISENVHMNSRRKRNPFYSTYSRPYHFSHGHNNFLSVFFIHFHFLLLISL